METPNKKSFVLYKDTYEAIKDLSLEEKGQLLDAIFQYQINPENPMGSLGSGVKMAFNFLLTQFRRDDEKYQKIVQRNKTNGLKGGRPKKPSGLFGNPKKPRKPDSDSDKDNNASYALKEKAWNDFSPAYLKTLNVSDPAFIQKTRQEFLQRAKAATQRAVHAWIDMQLKITPPDTAEYKSNLWEGANG